MLLAFPSMNKPLQPKLKYRFAELLFTPSSEPISTKTLLIHGDSDQVVSPNFMLEAKDFFIRNNVDIETHLIENCDHHIPIEASSIALNYILKKIK